MFRPRSRASTRKCAPYSVANSCGLRRSRPQPQATLFIGARPNHRQRGVERLLTRRLDSPELRTRVQDQRSEAATQQLFSAAVLIRVEVGHESLPPHERRHGYRGVHLSAGAVQLARHRRFGDRTIHSTECQGRAERRGWPHADFFDDPGFRGGAPGDKRHRRGSKSLAGLHPKLADAFLPVGDLQLCAASADERQSAPRLQLHANRTGAASRVVVDADADDELVARRDGRRHVRREDEIAADFSGSFCHTDASGTRADSHNAQAAIEMIRHGVRELAAFSAGADDAGPVSDRGLALLRERIQMPRESGIRVAARRGKREKAREVRQDQVKNLRGLALPASSSGRNSRADPAIGTARPAGCPRLPQAPPRAMARPAPRGCAASALASRASAH